MPEKISLKYRVAGSVVQSFHDSPAFGRGIIGPIGSGKSVACCTEILQRAAAQRPGADGVRRTRWIVIRSTYGELRTATLKTWSDWCPFEIGKLTMDAPIVHRVQRDGLDMEVLFLALDREADQQKLLSVECTGAWVNEARLCPKPIIDTLVGRIGRFPSARDGGPSWSGVLLDSNAPDTESWLYRMSEIERPEGWEFFRQPGGLADAAENIANLPGGRDYYRRTLAAADPDWARVFVHNEFGFVVEGKPVYGSYRDSVHCSSVPLVANPALPLLIGVDFGLTPAAVIGQRLPDGRWQIIDEVVTDDCGTQRFGEALASYIAREYPRFAVEGWTDPAGAQRAQTDEKTCLEVIKAVTGWRWHPAPDNAIAMRLEAVKGCLNRLVDGVPGLLLSPKCATVRKGFMGGYHYRLVRSGSGALYDERPNKNSFSHPLDALGYLLSGGGEASVVLRRQQRGPRQQVAITDYPIFDR